MQWRLCSASNLTPSEWRGSFVRVDSISRNVFAERTPVWRFMSEYEMPLSRSSAMMRVQSVMAHLIQGSDGIRNSLLSARCAAMQRMGIGGRVRQRRIELGLTIAELAKASDLSNSAISELESGRSKGSPSIHKIAAALEVSPEWLGGESDEVRPVQRGPVNFSLLVDCVAGVDEGFARRNVPADKKARIICALYDDYSRRKARPARAEIIEFVRRIA